MPVRSRVGLRARLEAVDGCGRLIRGEPVARGRVDARMHPGSARPWADSDLGLGGRGRGGGAWVLGRHMLWL